MSIVVNFFVNHKSRHGRIITVFAILFAIALSVSSHVLHSQGDPGDLW